METSINIYTCQSRLVGAEAKRLLVPGFSGKVLAVLSNTVYLIGQGDEVLWVAREGSPVHRRCILTRFPLHSICAGQPFFMSGNRLQIGTGIVVELSRAMEWTPSTVGQEAAAPLPNVAASLKKLTGTIQVQVLNRADGLGQSIQLISSVGGGRAIPDFPEGSLVAYAANSIQELARACVVRDVARVALTGRELVGLGPGLTPSGDDFLGGLFFAMASLKGAYPGEFYWDEGPIMELINWARTRTHPLSHIILNDLAHGHGPEPLHDMVSGLLRGEDPDGAITGAIRLLKIGQTSGGDILAGVLAGMLMVKATGTFVFRNKLTKFSPVAQGAEARTAALAKIGRDSSGPKGDLTPEIAKESVSRVLSANSTPGT